MKLTVELISCLIKRKSGGIFSPHDRKQLVQIVGLLWGRIFFSSLFLFYSNFCFSQRINDGWNKLNCEMLNVKWWPPSVCTIIHIHSFLHWEHTALRLLSVHCTTVLCSCEIKSVHIWSQSCLSAHGFIFLSVVSCYNTLRSFSHLFYDSPSLFILHGGAACRRVLA